MFSINIIVASDARHYNLYDCKKSKFIRISSGISQFTDETLFYLQKKQLKVNETARLTIKKSLQ